MRAIVFGCSGPVGVGLMAQLVSEGAEVVGVCRSGRSETPAGARVVAGDAADAEAAARLAQGAQVVFGTMGLPYPSWPSGWPRIIEGLLTAAERASARMVFADNLYAYGPQDQPLREDLTPTSYGSKPALRATMSATLLAAHREGRVPVALVRASDFYGPRTTNSLLGERVFDRLRLGKPAQFIGDVDQPHAVTYVPDFVRALATVSRAEDAFGQVWHVPNAPAETFRHIVDVVARAFGQPARVAILPRWLLSLAGLVSPTMRELKEMSYQFDRPFLVDHAKYARRFGATFTPLEEGLAITAAWYRQRA